MEVLAPGEPLAPAYRPRRDPRRGEALLRIRATSVNFHDHSGVNGRIANLPWPRIPFSDASREPTAPLRRPATSKAKVRE